LVTEKSEIGENGQIQFGTVAGGSAHEIVSDDLPGAFPLADFGEDDPDEHPTRIMETADIRTPANRSRRRAPDCRRFIAMASRQCVRDPRLCSCSRNFSSQSANVSVGIGWKADFISGHVSARVLRRREPAFPRSRVADFALRGRRRTSGQLARSDSAEWCIRMGVDAHSARMTSRAALERFAEPPRHGRTLNRAEDDVDE
jgi:hypothetical protein